MSRNRVHNARNPHQGEYKKVLCVCSAGLLRSPTAALVLSQPPFNFNTRAAGCSKDYGLIVVDEVLLAWADEIVCMTDDQQNYLQKTLGTRKPVVCLDIEDDYAYRDPALIELVKERYFGNSDFISNPTL